MSNSEAPISVTFKTTKQSLVTIRANDAEEFSNIVAHNVTILADAVKEAEEAIHSTVGGPATAAPTKQQAVSSLAKSLGAIVVTEGANGPNAESPDRFCVHGRMNRLEGNGQYGLYKGFFCPTPKGSTDKCATQYVKKQEPEFVHFYADKK